MKMMKSPNKNVVFYVISTVLILFNYFEIKYFCGNEGSKKFTETIKNTKTILQCSHVLEFIGLSGKPYKIDLSLYTYNKSLLNSFVLDDSESNIKYTAKDFYNIFNHIFMNVYMNPEIFKTFLVNELKDTKKLSMEEINDILKIYEQNAINFILTKQALTRIVLKSGDYLNIDNLPISDFLVNGEASIQHINKLAQIINAGKLIDLLKYFSSSDYLEYITSGQSQIKLFENIYITPDCLDYIYNLTSDMVDLYNNKVTLFKPNTSLVLNNVTIKDSKVLWSKFVLQEIILEKPKFVTCFMDNMNKSNIFDDTNFKFLEDLKKKKLIFLNNNLHLN
jgi:hypothetical protein